MSAEERAELAPPNLNTLMNLEKHFYSQFEHFRQSAPESRIIVPIEVVGFQPFLKSTGIGVIHCFILFFILDTLYFKVYLVPSYLSYCPPSCPQAFHIFLAFFQSMLCDPP